MGGRNAARGLEQLQKENIQLLVSCQDPTLTARHITDAYHLPEGMVVLLDQEQCAALGAATAEDTGSEGCCILCTNGFASLTGGLRAAEQAQNAETTATTVQLVSVCFSVFIAVLLTYAGLKFFVEVCGVWPTPAKMVTTLLTTVYSFLAAKYFTFRHAEKPE